MSDMDCGLGDAEKLEAAVAALDALKGIHMHIADARDVARTRAYLRLLITGRRGNEGS